MGYFVLRYLLVFSTCVLFRKLVGSEETSTWFPNIDVLLKSPEEIELSLKTYKIIPDLLDKAPKYPVQAWWLEGPEGPEADFGEGIEGPEAEFGKSIDDLNVLKEEPYWLEWKAENGSLYTVVMTGIDERCQKHTRYREKQYWIIGNIKEYDFVSGEYITHYLGPNPPEASGSHRYVFLVYKQKYHIEFKEPKIAAGQDGKVRSNFSSKLFADKYDLGEPMAVNFFRVKHITY